MASLSRSYFVYAPGLRNFATGISHANDFVNAKSHAREKVRAEDLINYPANRVSFDLPR